MSQKIGVAWYSRDTWTRLRAVAPDPDGLENTYEEWLQIWYAAVARLRERGLSPGRADVDFDTFAGWCAAGGFALDSAARARFVSEELQRREEDSRVRDL